VLIGRSPRRGRRRRPEVDLSVGGGDPRGRTPQPACLVPPRCLYRTGQPVHVLVCRLTMASIGDAQRAIAMAPAAPVLAVVADIPRAGLTGGMRARLRMSESPVPATVMLPYVCGWRDLADPWTAAVTWQQDPRVPRPMRAFVAAVGRLAAAVTPLLRPLATPDPPAVAAQALAPAAMRSGAAPSAAAAAAGRPVIGPAAAAVIAARGDRPGRIGGRSRRPHCHADPRGPHRSADTGPPRRPQPDSREMNHAPPEPDPHDHGPGRPGRHPATEAAGAARAGERQQPHPRLAGVGGSGRGVGGVLICALMIIVGRRNRNQMATEGVFSLAWVFGGLSLVAVAASLVGAFL
jgi:hypothetical protein